MWPVAPTTKHHLLILHRHQETWAASSLETGLTSLHQAERGGRGSPGRHSAARQRDSPSLAPPPADGCTMVADAICSGAQSGSRVAHR